MMIENSAVFVNGKRKFRNVNVDVNDDDTITVQSRVAGAGIAPQATYSVVEVAKAGMAWDVEITDAEGNVDVARLVVQQGCGCTGMKPYQNDPEYKGSIPGKK